jgi:lipopolysaccharide assembly outer membrane protein LptD (OstA)
MAAFSAAAFDSQAWLAKRSEHTRNAVMMRTSYSNCAARVDSPAEKVRIPVEQFPDGSVEILLEAEKMQYFGDTGLIFASGVKITKFDESRKVVSGIKAESCVVDRATKRGWAQGKVYAVQGRSFMRGDSAYFSSPDDYLQVYGNVFLKSLDLEFGGMR